MFVQLLAATGVLAVLTVVPGPDMAVVTKRAIASGPQDGLRTVGGIVAGLLVRGVLTVVGLAAVLASATAYTVVKLVGALYLGFLGVQTLLVLLRAVLTLAWLGGYVMVPARARTFFARPSVRRAMDRVTGVVLIGFGVKVATSQP
ncbi:LysE family translocator [Streptomyces sp. NPDC056488]|uniref:LysE family translocator n=1 Tax=Streptomyces sp. NPDC056488 TaxID=3345836 RepID=UPI003675242E